MQTGSNYPVQPGLHILLSGFHNPQGNDICSSFLSIPSGSLSFIHVLICVPVLSPHLDQFPPFADVVAVKHLALTLMQPHRTCQATVRQTRPNYSNYTLLAFAISLVPLLLRGGLPL